MLDKAHVQRLFERSAASYDGVAGMQRDIVNDLAECLLGVTPKHPPMKSIVDIGCGTGYGLQALSKCFSEAHLTGLDLADAMLDVAKQQSIQARFVQGDIEALPFINNTYDLVWSSSAIQWCDLATAVSELIRVAKPDGQLAISTFADGTLKDWRALWGVSEATASKRFETLSSIKRAFDRPDLCNVNIVEKEYRQHFGSFSSAVASIRDLGAGNAEYDRPHGLLGRQHYRQIKAQVNQDIEQNGCLVLPYKVVFITACKKNKCP